MNREQLIERLSDIEGEDFEVKTARRSVPKDVRKTVSAFANTAGGWVVFGVEKHERSFTVIGVEAAEKVEQDFTSMLRGQTFNRPVQVSSSFYTIEGKKVLAFRVPPHSARQKPIYFGGQQRNTFIRTGSGDQRATPDEIDAMHRNASFDTRDEELTLFGIDGIDHGTLERYRALFRQLSPGHQYHALSDEDFLVKLRCIRDGKLAQAGLLVFGTEDALVAEKPHYRIEYLEIAGTSYSDAPERYSYRISHEGNLFDAFFDMYQRLMRRIDVPFRLTGGLRDADPPQAEALREALVNLLIHTDYHSTASPRIRVFNDRFEFMNPGGLPKKIDVILREDYSQSRNPSVARMFRLIRLAENIGSGFTKMFTGWRAYQGTEPVIDGAFDSYKITFIVRTGIGTGIGTGKRRTGRTASIQSRILDLMREIPTITAAEIAGRLGESPSTIRYHIEVLKGDDLLTRRGGKRSGRWVIR